jgi:hypothetical protein
VKLRFKVMGVSAAAVAFSSWANPALNGRWAGEVSMAGTPLRLIVDVAPAAAPAAASSAAPSWMGSVVLPGRG